AIATARLLPAAIGILIAAFSLAAGPTGLICIAALIAGSRPVLQVIVKRARGGVATQSVLEEARARVRGAGDAVRDPDAKPTQRPRGSVASGVFRYASLLAPGLAAGTLVLVVIFADQTLATVMEATRV